MTWLRLGAAIVLASAMLVGSMAGDVLRDEISYTPCRPPFYAEVQAYVCPDRQAIWW